MKSDIQKFIDSPGQAYGFATKSAGGRSITGWYFPVEKAKKRVLIFGGVHGDESEGIHLAEKCLEKIQTGDWKFQLDVAILPRFNPDGVEENQRKNANGVDLNRNMPTKDWTSEVAKEKYFPGKEAGSEPETQLMVDIIEGFEPDLILSAHSWEPCINYNGPSKEVAEIMSGKNGYRVTADIGYPTPGSLGTWAGWERKIPTITFEAERGLSPEENWDKNGEAFFAALKWLEN